MQELMARQGMVSLFVFFFFDDKKWKCLIIGYLQGNQQNASQQKAQEDATRSFFAFNVADEN